MYIASFNTNNSCALAYQIQHQAAAAGNSRTVHGSSTDEEAIFRERTLVTIKQVSEQTLFNSELVCVGGVRLLIFPPKQHKNGLRNQNKCNGGFSLLKNSFSEKSTG